MHDLSAHKLFDLSPPMVAIKLLKRCMHHQHRHFPPSYINPPHLSHQTPPTLTLPTKLHIPPHISPIKLKCCLKMMITAGKRRKTTIPTTRATRSTTTVADIPNDVVEHILTYLPIKLAVQVGSTSNRLKRSWRLSRNFDFGKNFLKQNQKDQMSNIVGSILKEHEGDKVDRLCINVPRSFIPMTVIHSWVEFAISKGLKELDLEAPRLNGSFLNPKLLDGARLESLRLSSCSFGAVPMKFDHFFSLKKLTLDRIYLLPNLLSSFLANCLSLEMVEVVHCRMYSMLTMSQPHPRLQSLCIIDCKGLLIKDILTPKLSIFKYQGYYLNFNFPIDWSLNMLLLEEVSITFTNDVPWPSSRLMTLLHSLARVRMLSIDSKIFERITPKVRRDKLLWTNFSYIRLEEFNLKMVDITCVNPLDIACFLARCPALLKFSIDLEGYNFESYSLYWEIHGKEKLAQFIPRFNKLKEIKVKGFKLHEMEILLVKFLLCKTPNLETMTLMPPKKCRPRIAVADLLRYKCTLCLSPASPKVQVIVREQSKGDAVV